MGEMCGAKNMAKGGIKIEENQVESSNDFFPVVMRIGGRNHPHLFNANRETKGVVSIHSDLER